MYHQALVMAKGQLGDADPLVVMMTGELAGFHFARGNFPEWEALTRQLLATQRKLLGNENRNVARTLAELAGALISNGRSAEAEPIARESLALHRRLYGSEHIEVAKVANDLGAALINLNRRAEAEPLLSEALATARRLLPPDDPVVIVSIQNLGIVLAAQEKYAEAERLFREQVALARKALANEPGKLDDTSSNRTNQQPTYVVKIAGPLSAPALDVALDNLADAVYRQKKYPEAEALYREKLQRLRTGRSSEDKEIVSTSASLGRLLADWAWAERSDRGRSPVRSSHECTHGFPED
jgi:tetratricopeptide (TPR) repeat protein